MGDTARRRVGMHSLPRSGAIETTEPVAPFTVSCAVDARIETSVASNHALLDAVGLGRDEFVLTSLDGSVSARVRLTLGERRYAEPVFRGGAVAVDWSRSTVTNGANHVTLSNTELRLLAALLEGNGQAVPRAALIGRVWPRDALPAADRENALAVYVWSLRKRLAAIGLRSALETVRRFGYRVAF